MGNQGNQGRDKAFMKGETSGKRREIRLRNDDKRGEGLARMWKNVYEWEN